MKNINLMLFLTLSLTFFSCAQTTDWRTATKESAKIAPLPSVEKEAVVQVYAAKTVSWRGYFSVHSWVVTKEKNAPEYTTYHVIGWRAQRGLPVIRVEKDIPDRHWFGARPELIASYIGPKAEAMIPEVEAAVKSYPYAEQYRAWPGPNSNTFVSHIIRSTKGMTVELPSNAIGKDWIYKGQPLGWSETKTGIQFSIVGALGFTLGLGEGVEVNVLGLSFGVDFLRPALKLPLVGRVGMDDKPVFD
nr:DUF3750 domain-containing protein [Bacteriovorax sp. HI3]